MLDSDLVPETGIFEIFEIKNSLAVDLIVAYFRDWFDECFLWKQNVIKWLDQLCNIIIYVTELCNFLVVKLYSPQFDEKIWKECFSFIENCTWKIQIEKSYANPVFT